MIIVSSLNDTRRAFDESGAGYVLSLLGPDAQRPEFSELHPSRHKILIFNDITEEREDLIAPTPAMVKEIMQFIDIWGATGAILIHCWAGISRSTAAAFIGNCLLNPQEDEDDLADELRVLSPSATPNRLMVQHADALMKRDGRMVKAIDRIGRGEDAASGNVFAWEVKR